MPYGKPLVGVCMATAIFVCSAVGLPILPQTPPPPTASLTLPSSGGSARLTAGAPVEISGGGFAAHANIVVGVYSSPTELDAVTADAGGAFTDTVTIPRSLSGSHTLVAQGNAPDGSARVLSTPIMISAAAATPGSLPFTGARALPITLIGLCLLVGGFVLTRAAALGRRRVRRATHDRAAA